MPKQPRGRGERSPPRPELTGTPGGGEKIAPGVGRQAGDACRLPVWISLRCARNTPSPGSTGPSWTRIR